VSAQYGESLAGVRAITPATSSPSISPRAMNRRQPPARNLRREPRGEPGAADKRIQAYNFRVIATNVPDNRIPWPKPANYDP
jgi:hypothetical protein